MKLHCVFFGCPSLVLLLTERVFCFVRMFFQLYFKSDYGNVRLSAPVDYVLSEKNTYSVLQRMGCSIRHGADNRIAQIISILVTS